MKAEKLSTLKALLILTFLLLVAMVSVFIISPSTLEQKISAGKTIDNNFQFESINGPFSLQKTGGKVRVVYLGYSSCPDVCPTSLSVLAQAFNQLSSLELASVEGVFISVDPERDTPEKLAQYSRFFHPNIVGVTGSRSEIDRIVNAYGAFYRMVEMPDSAMGYAVDHSSRLYLLNQQGKLTGALNHGSSPDTLVKALRNLLSSTPAFTGEKP